jgi:hypothetical protein
MPKEKINDERIGTINGLPVFGPKRPTHEEATNNDFKTPSVSFFKNIFAPNLNKILNDSGGIKPWLEENNELAHELKKTIKTNGNDATNWLIKNLPKEAGDRKNITDYYNETIKLCNKVIVENESNNKENEVYLAGEDAA